VPDQPQIILVRHGETAWSAAGCHTGLTDVPLTAAGEAQARRLGQTLAGRPFTAALTSPLTRARDTCRLAGLSGAEVVEDLTEWDYGEIEGRTTAEIREERPDWSIWTHGAPGGESVQAVSTRVDRVLAGLLDREGEVVVVAHGHLLRALAARWLELPVVEGRRLRLEAGATGELGWDHGVRALVAWNLQNS
jgi:probable phosphoglycerate mutase